MNDIIIKEVNGLNDLDSKTKFINTDQIAGSSDVANLASLIIVHDGNEAMILKRRVTLLPFEVGEKFDCKFVPFIVQEYFMNMYFLE